MRRPWRLGLLVCGVCALLVMTWMQPAEAGPTRTDAEQTIDAYIHEQMRRLHIPGLALAVVRGDQIETMRGYGTAGEDGRPVTPQTPFLVASLSKPITATAIMQLVEAGKLSLDAPVMDYLPWFQTSDARFSAQITIRHLLNHTSGFSTLSGDLRNLSRDHAEDALERSLRGLTNARLNAAPGEQFEYSNTNYDLLGMVIQAVSGQTYEAYVEEHIFRPLNMRNSYTALAEARAGGLSSGYVPVYGFNINYDRSMPYSRTVRPSAGLFSSAEDMAYFLIAHLNQGRSHAGPQILSPEGIEKLHTPGILFNDQAGYAMGWVTFPFAQITAANTPGAAAPAAISHGGEWANYKLMMAAVPDLDLGVVVLINKFDQRQIPEYEQITWNTAMIAAGLEPTIFPSEKDFLTRFGHILGGGVILFLVASFAWSLGVLGRKRRGHPEVPSRDLVLAFLVGMPLFDLALIGFFLLEEFKGPVFTLPLTLAFNPEVGLIYLIILFFSVGWGAIRTGWFLNAFSTGKPNQSHSNQLPAV